MGILRLRSPRRRSGSWLCRPDHPEAETPAAWTCAEADEQAAHLDCRALPRACVVPARTMMPRSAARWGPWRPGSSCLPLALESGGWPPLLWWTGRCCRPQPAPDAGFTSAGWARRGRGGRAYSLSGG